MNHSSSDPAPLKRAPKQPRSEQSRAKLLQAAQTEFAEFGYDGASMRVIAAKAGYNHGLIRYHFGNKAQLWKDVVTEMHDRLERAMSPEVTGPIDLSTAAGLKIFIRHYVRYCAAHPEQARIMIVESLKDSDRLDWMISHIRKSHARLAPKFFSLMKTGVLPEIWLVSLFYSISTICQMPFVLSKKISNLYGVNMQSEAAIEAHTEAIVALLIRDQKATQVSDWPSLPAWVSSER